MAATRPGRSIVSGGTTSITFDDTSDWGTGFAAGVTIANRSGAPISGWTLEFDLASTITNIWGAQILSRAGSHYVVRNLSWDAVIGANDSVSFGFLADQGNPVLPTAYVLNGAAIGGVGPDPAPAPLPVIRPQGATVHETAPGPFPGGTGNGAGSLLPAGYLGTKGNQIVDANGDAVKIAAVNWFGLGTASFSPHGLWARNYQSMMDQMVQLGFNAIRLSFSLQLFDPGSTPSAIDFGKNPDLQGLDGLQIMDEVVAYAGRIGLKVILDDHRSAAGDDSNENGLWYGAGYTEADWIATWEMLARHYAGDATVIGADLFNEPHGPATWGDGSATDWAAAATRGGNAVLSANPDWLVFVEGIENYEGTLTGWGANLTGVRDHPITLALPNKLVYSPHDYPASVYPWPWFSAPDYPANLPEFWNRSWGYIYDSGTAPLWIGEFGTEMRTTSDRQWLSQLVKYMDGDLAGSGGPSVAAGQQGMSWAYWSWNPNSTNTGGILADDWQTVNRAKVDAIQPAEYHAGSGGGSGTGSTPAPGLGGTAALQVTSDWGSGMTANVTVSNPGDVPLHGWEVRLTTQDVITNIWNGVILGRNGDDYLVGPASYNQDVTAHSSVQFGFQATEAMAGASIVAQLVQPK